MADDMDNPFPAAFKSMEDAARERKAELQTARRTFEFLSENMELDSTFGTRADAWAHRFVKEKPEAAAEWVFEMMLLFALCEAFYASAEGEDIMEHEWRVLNTLSAFDKRRPFGLPYHVRNFMLQQLAFFMGKEPRTAVEEREHIFRRKIINHFGTLFPDLEFICIEKPTRKGRVDIYAEAKADRRPVLMELKVSGTNPAGQLLEYALDFKDPRLIAITRKPIDKGVRVKGVEYFTYGNGRLSSEASS